MYQYRLTENRLYTEELGQYVSFGIDVANSSGQIILSVPDVSPDRQLVTDLCACCTQLQLDPIHLFDVLEDTL